MAFVDVGLQYFPQPRVSGSTHGTLVIDAADEVASVMIPISKTGSISHVHFRTGSVVTGATVDVRLETISATDGNPTGTLWGTNTNGSQVISSTDDDTWFRAALTASASVTKGDIVAVLIVNPTSSFGNIQVVAGIAWGNSSTSLGICYGNNPTRSTKVNIGIMAVLEYSDGTVCYSYSLITLYRSVQSLNTGLNPDELAVYFTAPYTMEAIGWGGLLSIAAGANYRVSLYEDGNNTPIASQEHDGDLTQATTTRTHTGFFDSPAVIKRSFKYRLSYVPLTANSITVYYLEGPSGTPAVIDTHGLIGAQLSERNRSSTTDPDSASWTQTANRTLQIYLIIGKTESS